MNKTDLIAGVVKDTGLSKKDAEAALISIVNNIENSVKKGDTVQLIGFGSFKRVSRSARKGVNPVTGETIKIPAKKVVKFSVGKAFADKVNAKTSTKKPATKTTAKKSTVKKAPAKKTAAKKSTAKKK
jgi:DNA-binding protein HU-beta